MTYTKEDKLTLLKALREAKGLVSYACDSVGIDRSTHYDWMKEDMEYAKEVTSIRELVIDFAEKSLFKQIENGETASTIFLLKTVGSSRGYREKQEHLHHIHEDSVDKLK